MAKNIKSKYTSPPTEKQQSEESYSKKTLKKSDEMDHQGKPIWKCSYEKAKTSIREPDLASEFGGKGPIE